MEKGQPSILFPYEPDRFWEQIRTIIKEELANQATRPVLPKEEAFLPRMEVARMLRVSLVTLNSWVKLGMPCHKQMGKVYFLKSEVLNYIKNKTRLGN